jgi:hypothetical protein
MQQIVERLSLTIMSTATGSTEVVYGDFLDGSLFARISCSFSDILDDRVLVGMDENN